MARTAGVYLSDDSLSHSAATGTAGDSDAPSASARFSAGDRLVPPPASGTASTVLDCTGEAPRVLRAGALTLDDLKGCLS